YGSWRVAAANPERFAAVAPICGGPEPDKWAKSLAKVPIWAVQGAKDEIGPLARSQEMGDDGKAPRGALTLTAYPGAKHASWPQTYDNPEVYKWLLTHRRKKPQAADWARWASHLRRHANKTQISSERTVGRMTYQSTMSPNASRSSSFEAAITR